mmetsp:Transcript_74368/g.177202  ORF Transcript_74368/g.177202 Transcript_74368/m.177202 type:complete len:362 (-) Transcript_74368:3638-4723(-)
MTGSCAGGGRKATVATMMCASRRLTRRRGVSTSCSSSMRRVGSQCHSFTSRLQAKIGDFSHMRRRQRSCALSFLHGSKMAKPYPGGQTSRNAVCKPKSVRSIASGGLSSQSLKGAPRRASTSPFTNSLTILRAVICRPMTRATSGGRSQSKLQRQRQQMRPRRRTNSSKTSARIWMIFWTEVHQGRSEFLLLAAGRLPATRRRPILRQSHRGLPQLSPPASRQTPWQLWSRAGPSWKELSRFFVMGPIHSAPSYEAWLQSRVVQCLRKRKMICRRLVGVACHLDLHRRQAPRSAVARCGRQQREKQASGWRPQPTLRLRERQPSVMQRPPLRFSRHLSRHSLRHRMNGHAVPAMRSTKRIA